MIKNKAGEVTKQTIEIDVPDGYEFDLKHLRFNTDCIPEHMYIGLKKKPPRRRVFECVSEEPRFVEPGEWYESVSGLRYCTDNINPLSKHVVYKEITEQEKLGV